MQGLKPQAMKQRARRICRSFPYHLQTQITVHLRDRLVATADLEGQPVARIVRDILEQYFAEVDGAA